MRCIHHLHQIRRCQQSKYCQSHCKHSTCNQCRRYGGLHPSDVTGSKIRRDYDRTTDIAADGNCHKDHCDRIRRPDSRQRIFSRKPAGDRAVRNIIQLLKYNTDKHRYRKAPQNRSNVSFGKIFYHKDTPSF